MDVHSAPRNGRRNGPAWFVITKQAFTQVWRPPEGRHSSEVNICRRECVDRHAAIILRIAASRRHLTSSSVTCYETKTNS